MSFLLKREVPWWNYPIKKSWFKKLIALSILSTGDLFFQVDWLEFFNKKKPLQVEPARARVPRTGFDMYPVRSYF